MNAINAIATEHCLWFYCVKKLLWNWIAS